MASPDRALRSACGLRRFCTVALLCLSVPAVLLFNRLSGFRLSAGRTLPVQLPRLAVAQQPDVQLGIEAQPHGLPTGTSETGREEFATTVRRPDLAMRSWTERLQLLPETPKFYIMSGKDHPVFNSDVCQALPFSWHSASIDLRLATSACGTLSDNLAGTRFGKCSPEAKEKEMQQAPKGFSAKSFPWSGQPSESKVSIACSKCTIGGSAATEVDFYIELASRHPARVMDPDKAEIFLVPFDFQRSAYQENTPCPARNNPHKVEPGYETHRARLQALTLFLISSKLWRERGARRFFFPETVWYYESHGLYMGRGPVGAFRKVIYQNASWGLGSSAWRKPDTAGCVTILPWMPKAHVYTPDVSYEVWRKRSLDVWYRYGKRTCCGLHLVGPLKYAARNMKKLKHIINWVSAVPTYIDEFHDSKFCVHMRLDDPNGHRFPDAIGALCIPVIIADAHYPHFSPFHKFLNYSDFTLNIKEKDFINNTGLLEASIQKVLDDPARLRHMFDSLLVARKVMISYHPNSQLLDYALSEMKQTCLKDSPR